METHCFQGARSRDSVSDVNGVPPRRFSRDKKGMDVRLCNPGVDWDKLDQLKEKYIQKFDDSLDEYLTKCFAKRNLRLSRSSVGGRPQQFTLSSIRTPGLSKTRSRAIIGHKRPKLAIIISDDEEACQNQEQSITSIPIKQHVDQSFEQQTDQHSLSSPSPVDQQYCHNNSPPSAEQKSDSDHPRTPTMHRVDHYSPTTPANCNSPALADDTTPVQQQIGHNSPVSSQVDSNSPILAEQQDDRYCSAPVEQVDNNSPTPAEQQVDCINPVPNEQQNDHNSPVTVEQRIGYDSPIVPFNQNLDHNSPSTSIERIDHALVSSEASAEDMMVDQPVEDEPMTTAHSDLDSAAAQTEDSDSFHTPRGSSEEENEAAKYDQEVQKNKLRQQRLENVFGMKGSENKPKHQPVLKVAKSFLPRNSPRRPETHEEKNKQLQEKMAKKKADEELRQKELALRKEQERLERIKKREEKLKRVQEKQALLQKVEEQKKEKIAGQRTKQQQLKEKLQQEQQKKKEERNQRQRERMLAAESRRKQEEEHKKQKILKAEEERRMIEEIHRKRMEAEDERRRVEAAEREKQRIREREEREAQEREREAEMKKRKEQQEDPPKRAIPADPVDKMLLHWKQQLDQRKAAKDTTAIARLPPIFSSSSSTKPALDTTFIKPAPSVISSPHLNKHHQKYAGIASYELTPANSLEEAENNYNISDLSSDDSTDDESCPKKKVPKWAASTSVNRVMSDQESRVKQHPDISDRIFPPEELLLNPDLSNMFKKKRKRFYERSSSAHWTSPLIKKTRPNT